MEYLKQRTEDQNVFTLKDIFKDITLSELQFMNTALKKCLSLHSVEPLPKVIRAGDTWPSNQWPTETKDIACSLLVAFRKLGRRVSARSKQEIVEKYVEYTAIKWGKFIPFYDGEWEDFAQELGVQQ